MPINMDLTHLDREHFPVDNTIPGVKLWMDQCQRCEVCGRPAGFPLYPPCADRSVPGCPEHSPTPRTANTVQEYFLCRGFFCIRFRIYTSWHCPCIRGRTQNTVYTTVVYTVLCAGTYLGWRKAVHHVLVFTQLLRFLRAFRKIYYLQSTSKAKNTNASVLTKNLPECCEIMCDWRGIIYHSISLTVTFFITTLVRA